MNLLNRFVQLCIAIYIKENKQRKKQDFVDNKQRPEVEIIFKYHILSPTCHLHFRDKSLHVRMHFFLLWTYLYTYGIINTHFFYRSANA